MQQPAQVGGISKGVALHFVLLLGLVSLFADMTYEGARSITGPFLAVLGASATVVGAIAGAGELVGYGLRLLSGYLSDRTGRYWAITLVGYFTNLLAVPLLALAGRWEFAALLMLAERAGKAIRTPARDVMLSQATRELGRGWGFGIHEAMDQIGALLGPLFVVGVLYVRGGAYQAGFAALALPAALSLGVLLVARLRYPNPRQLEPASVGLEPRGLPRVFWLYLVGVALIAAGYADFPLIAYHFEKESVVPAVWIPVFYAVAMGVDALAALACGRLFDRYGFAVLMAVAALSAFFAPLVFLGGASLALFGVALWGTGMGAQESIMRAAVAGMVPMSRRGTAYGVFNTGYGLAWFAGSVLMGLLYDHALPWLIVFAVVVQLAALPVFLLVRRAER
jgi:MFS family permease